MKDYYSILEIGQSAGEEDIKKSYRALALRYHPDRNANDPNGAEKFKEITEAYAVLMDPEKRRKYDNYWMNGQTRSGPGGPHFGYSQEDIFRDLFNDPRLYGFFNDLGREFGKSGMRFGPSFFENIFFRQGGLFLVGAIFSAFSPIGRAYKLYNFFRLAQTAHATYKKYKEFTGENPNDLVEEKPKKKDQLKEKFKGLFGKSDVPPKEKNISFRLRITPKDAAEGAEKPMAFTVDGYDEKLTVKIPPGTQNGTRLRLKGKGPATQIEGERGDVYLLIEVG